jgi:hypothetical protein
VHPVRALLASRSAGPDLVSNRVADPASIPIVGGGRQRCTGIGMGRGHATGAIAAQTDCQLRDAKNATVAILALIAASLSVKKVKIETVVRRRAV